jgi:tripartite-type tricarboxylate transporter receptor subunit TctC
MIAALFAVQSALAQSWPDKPIRLVVPFSAGGNTDIVARLFAQELTKSLEQPVIVDNKPGASGNIGADAVAKSPADGHTFRRRESVIVSAARAPGFDYEKLARDPRRR